MILLESCLDNQDLSGQVFKGSEFEKGGKIFFSIFVYWYWVINSMREFKISV